VCEEAIVACGSLDDVVVLPGLSHCTAYVITCDERGIFYRDLTLE